jgi:hypothetical protein
MPRAAFVRSYYRFTCVSAQRNAQERLPTFGTSLRSETQAYDALLILIQEVTLATRMVRRSCRLNSFVSNAAILCKLPYFHRFHHFFNGEFL